MALSQLAFLKRATFAQAARVLGMLGRRKGRDGGPGRDAMPEDESVRFVASQRMGLPHSDLQDIVQDGERARIIANILGNAGRTPALPPPYSEMQLERRRARDNSFADFLNLFDHRALSFFYRIEEKYRWPLLVERTGTGERDPIGGLMLALAGMDGRGEAGRLDLPDEQLIPLTVHLADSRRSAHSVETVLRGATGMDLQVVEAQPVWMAVPPSEQSRLGFGRLGCFNQLGVPDDLPAGEPGQAAMIGEAVLDVQHHFLIVLGPMPYARLRAFCAEPGLRRLVSQLAALAAGLDQRPSLRLRIAAHEIPPLRLGDEDTPAMLGWTTWLGEFDSDAAILEDCVIPIDQAAIHQEKAVVERAAAV
jgi:type VI secretion system protein ImpH